MATTTEIADQEEIYRAVRERRRPDPEAAKRVRDRADAAKQRLRGILDLAVPLIREAREE